MRPPPQPAANADRRNAVPAHARRLAVVLEILVLLAVILLRFSSLFHSPNDEQGATLIPQTLKLASRWGVVFALLVPLQVISFGWLWLESCTNSPHSSPGRAPSWLISAPASMLGACV
ncbi:MAG: hypothetical protein ACK59A_04185 [Cyanobacteriota bacterium]|jgi:hypothetical protein